MYLCVVVDYEVFVAEALDSLLYDVYTCIVYALFCTRHVPFPFIVRFFQETFMDLSGGVICWNFCVRYGCKCSNIIVVDIVAR